MLEELKEKFFLVKMHYLKDEIHESADNHQFALTYHKNEVIEGWAGCTKDINAYITHKSSEICIVLEIKIPNLYPKLVTNN